LFINQILDGLKHIHKPQLNFLTVLFTTIFVCGSRINFSSLARHSALNEKTFRRNFRKDIDFIGLNETIVSRAKCQIEAFAMDATFIKKSGKDTFGLDKFWNGCAGKAEKGLEASIISLIDVKQNASFVLTVDQTEPKLAFNEKSNEKKTRTDFYAEQLEKNAETILKQTKIGVFDGFYAKQKFVQRTVTMGFTMISRLRQDANLKHLYTGAQKPKGRPRKFAEKVDLTDLSKFKAETVKIQNKQIRLSSATVWSPRLKREIKLVVVKFKNKSVNLCATDVEMLPSDIFKFYRSRFSIEFLIRDAKQSGGLSDCQARDNKAIEFHWNASLTSVNFARGMSQTNEKETEKKPFSMKSIKQQFFNEHLLKLFICKSGLEQSLIKYEETLASLRNYAVIYS
jgi:hypothetical protein